MNVHKQVEIAQLDTQAFALMSRLHVILRRECGRITDIEYMRMDPAYCKHVLDLGERMPNEALPAICARLREIFFGASGLFVVTPPRPLLAGQTASPLPPSMEPSTPAHVPARQDENSVSGTATPSDASVTPSGQAYVGRLR